MKITAWCMKWIWLLSLFAVLPFSFSPPSSYAKEQPKPKIVNVKAYGAVGNGKTDDSAAIQRAMDAANGRPVFFPKGVYALAKAITIRGNHEVYGDKAVLEAIADEYSMFNTLGENIHIHNLIFDGFDHALRGITVLDGSKNVSIKDSILQHFGQPESPELADKTPVGIRIEGGVENVLIDHCVIQHVFAKNPIVNWGHKVARGVLISPASDKQPPTHNIVLQHSMITNIGPKDDGDGIVVQGFTTDVGVRIVQNFFSKTHKRAIKIQSPNAYIQGNRIFNNFYRNNYYETYSEPNDYEMWAAISVYASRVVILENRITGTGSFSAGIDIAGASDVTVQKNFVANGANANLTKADLIRVNRGGYGRDGFHRITITDNVLMNGRYGVYIGAYVKKLTISGNTHIGCMDAQSPKIEGKPTHVGNPVEAYLYGCLQRFLPTHW